MNSKLMLFATILVVGLAAFGYWRINSNANKPSSITTDTIGTKSNDTAPVPTNTTGVSMSPSPAAQAAAKKYAKADEVLKVGKKYTVTLNTTAGEIQIELNNAATPVTANNFAFLAKEKFYDNTIFHRTIKGFMIQGGDPTGTGMGGPGYKFADEPFTGEYNRGVVAMANSGQNTNGSQFFIMHADYPLPPNYVIFGKVVKGIEIVDAIATAPVKSGGREASSPVKPVVITSATLSEN